MAFGREFGELPRRAPGRSTGPVGAYGVRGRGACFRYRAGLDSTAQERHPAAAPFSKTTAGFFHPRICSADISRNAAF